MVKAAAAATLHKFSYNIFMRQRLWFFPVAILLFLVHPLLVCPQTATLKVIHAEGMKTFSQEQVAALCGLRIDSQVGKQDLQDAANLLLRSGLFAKVNYKYDTHNDALTLTFQVEESSRLTVTYDNFPWFGDSELSDAIRRDFPFYDGTLPEGGTIVDLAGNSLASFLTEHGLKAEVKHFVLANPLIDKNVQEFQVGGVTETIASIDFSDPSLKEDRAVQQHLSEIRGKPFSRMAIDVFLLEAIRPVYLSRGFVRAKIGPAEVRLTSNPNQKLPEDIPVYVPCEPGAVYHWKSAEWRGNSAVSSETLKRALGLNPGDVADGMVIEAGWDRAREAYGRLGYLEAKVDAQALYNDQAHTVSYAVDITEGKQFRFQEMVITGMSLAGERMIREAWPIKPGDVMDKTVFEHFLVQLDLHRETIFKELPVHYETPVGHWLQMDPTKGTVEVLLDFK